MSRRKSPKMNLVGGQPRTTSPVAIASRLRGGAGVHSDQRRKADPKQLRRDKSYKKDW